jgi:hypothetical protein
MQKLPEFSFRPFMRSVATVLDPAGTIRKLFNLVLSVRLERRAIRRKLFDLLV